METKAYEELNAEEITELQNKLEELKKRKVENCPNIIEKELIKRSLVSKYLKFEFDDDEKTRENEFYKKIITASKNRNLRKTYDICIKYISNVEKYRRKLKIEEEDFKRKGYDKVYDIKTYTCDDAECDHIWRYYISLDKCHNLDDKFKLFNDITQMFHSSQQAKSGWKTRLKTMDDTEPEKQLFNIVLRLNQECWELKMKIYKYRDINDYEQRDPFLHYLWDKQPKLHK